MVVCDDRVCVGSLDLPRGGISGDQCRSHFGDLCGDRTQLSRLARIQGGEGNRVLGGHYAGAISTACFCVWFVCLVGSFLFYEVCVHCVARGGRGSANGGRRTYVPGSMRHDPDVDCGGNGTARYLAPQIQYSATVGGNGETLRKETPSDFVNHV